MIKVLLTTLMVITVSASVDYFKLPQQQSNHSEELLEQYGKLMLASMNSSIDPCENFYEYSCGGWKKSELIPEHARNNGLTFAMQQKINKQVLEFLTNVSKKELEEEGDQSAELMAKRFYASCIEMKQNMYRGYLYMMEIQEENYENFKKKDTWDWIDINFMLAYDVYPLLPLEVDYNKSLRKYEILLKPPKNHLIDFNEKHLEIMTKDFGLDDKSEKKQFVELFRNLTLFEKNLTQLAKSRSETENLNLAEFLSKHREDRLNWTRYFDLAFNKSQENHWRISNELENINDLVYFLENTNNDTLFDYLHIRVLLKFYALWKTDCSSLTKTYFENALMPWFIGQLFDKERRADILGVAKDIKDTFYDLLEHYTWLDEETRSQAKTKLSSMDILVGYTDDQQHREITDQLYQGLNMTGDWFDNLSLLESYNTKNLLKSVNKASHHLNIFTQTVNAEYLHYLNVAFITIGMTQWPNYHLDFPTVLKYAGVGLIMGHEIAHGFDSNSYQFNYDGKYANWWSEESLRNFEERYRCLESQYNKFLVLGEQTNGTLTLGENIADNLGSRMAYYAYKKHTGDKRWLEKPLRNVDFNNKQLFFLKFAQAFCKGEDKVSILKNIQHDAHSYNEFRVVGTLSNMPEFSEAFKCKLGTEMNPLKKCVVW